MSEVLDIVQVQFFVWADVGDADIWPPGGSSSLSPCSRDSTGS